MTQTTSTGGQAPAPVPGDLADFYAAVGGYQLQPLWTQNAELMSATPRSSARPWLWRWSRLKALAERAGQLIPIDEGGDRRVLALANPGLAGLPFATETLWGAVQYLAAHERAPAHRHTPGAVRFVLEGSGVWTSVNGDACPMAAGDLVLTPGWNWHEHHNPGDEPMMWFDGLDLPLVQMLGSVFFEQGPEEFTADERQPAPATSLSERVWGSAGTLPEPVPADTRHSPLLAYRWQDTDRALAALLDQRGGNSVSIRFVDPSNGRDALPTMRCSMTRMLPAGRQPASRRTGSSVCVVFSGRGRTVIDGVAMEWSAGDMFTVPSWAAVDHEIFSTADVFAVSDTPLVEAARLDRSELLSQPQEVTSTCG
jgi:gentisate 1,2-dioxygenase